MDNVIKDKSFDFALRIVKLYKHLINFKGEYVMSKQLLRAGTSIGANVSEAVQAQTKPDFLTKMNVALKEAAETEYWLKLLLASEYLTKEEYKSVNDDCAELLRLLVSIVKTSKQNPNNKGKS